MTLVIGAIMMTANAQNPAGDNNGRPRENKERQMLTPEQRAERKADHISAKLMLDDATSAQFKSIYKDYEAEKAEVNKKYLPNRPERVDGEKPEKKELSDNELESKMKNGFAHRKAILDIEEKYYGKFRTILNPRQVAMVYKTDGRGKGFGKGKQYSGKGKHKKGKGKQGKGGMHRDGQGTHRGGHQI